MPRCRPAVPAASAFTSAASAVLAVLAIAAAIPASAGAQAPAAPGTVSATGSATVRPTPLDRTSNASIAKAVSDAQEQVLPLAIRAARDRAQRLATESGLVLGALVGIADGPTSPYGPYPGYGVEGTFGPGRYCGNVGRYRTTRRDGRVRRVRVGTRRICRVPPSIGTSVSVTFATVPPAPAPAV